MPGSRGRIGPGGVKGQRPCWGPEGATYPGRNFYSFKIGLSWTEIGLNQKVRDN